MTAGWVAMARPVSGARYLSGGTAMRLRGVLAGPLFRRFTANSGLAGAWASSGSCRRRAAIGDVQSGGVKIFAAARLEKRRPERWR